MRVFATCQILVKFVSLPVTINANFFPLLVQRGNLLQGLLRDRARNRASRLLRRLLCKRTRNRALQEILSIRGDECMIRKLSILKESNTRLTLKIIFKQCQSFQASL